VLPFVLENVKHLQHHDPGRPFRIIWETLTDHLIYLVHHRVIDAQSVVPQHREHVFLVGFRDRRQSQLARYGGRYLEEVLEIHRARRLTARVARKTARAHGTPIYLWRDGKVVAEKP
jgi:site-specific DNA-cytosine methylase